MGGLGLITINLKLHKPSAAKREVIDQAIINYNNAYNFLLENAHLRVDEIETRFKNRDGSYSMKTLSHWGESDIIEKLNQFNVQPFKDSLKLDLGMTLAGYFNAKLSGAKVGFPTLNDLNDGKLRPIYFCRYDIKRNYCLIYDAKKDRYFAKLYLMNSLNARTVSPREGKDRRLIYIDKAQNAFERHRKKETFIIIPLSFGKWQEQVLKGALEKPESLRTAKLLKKGNEYYLSINVDTGKVPIIKTSTFMGVARGLKNKLNYTIIDAKGNILDSGAVCGPEAVIGNEITIHELHKAANSIVDTALLYKSRVIVQNLTEKGDRLNWLDSDKTTYQPVYICRIYNQLVRLLEYKLQEKGLPAPAKVSSIDIFYTCRFCGLNSKSNRFSKDVFICTRCGTTYEIDGLGSLNLAGKLISYDASNLKIKVMETLEGVRFINKFIGLDFCVSNKGNQIEKLRLEIMRILDEAKKDLKYKKEKNLSKKMSMVKKFEGYEDIMQFVEFV